MATNVQPQTSVGLLPRNRSVSGPLKSALMGKVLCSKSAPRPASMLPRRHFSEPMFVGSDWLRRGCLKEASPKRRWPVGGGFGGGPAEKICFQEPFWVKICFLDRPVLNGNRREKCAATCFFSTHPSKSASCNPTVRNHYNTSLERLISETSTNPPPLTTIRQSLVFLVSFKRCFGCRLLALEKLPRSSQWLLVLVTMRCLKRNQPLQAGCSRCLCSSKKVAS